jgi:hypothetical protein
MIGQALPALATAPLSAGSLAGSLALNAGVGALESALDIGEPGTAAQRAAGGAAGGVFGDVAGRILGRAFNLAEGISQALGGRRLAGNAQSDAFEALGGETLAYQRMTPDTIGQQFAERVTQGSQASIWGAQGVKQLARNNEQLLNNTAAEAVGVPLPPSGALDVDWMNSALQYFDDGFRQIEQTARSAGQIEIPDKVAARLRNNPEIKAANIEDGLFQDILAGGKTLEPGEYIEARNTLRDHISSLYSRDKNARAIRAETLLDQLDDSIGQRLPKGFGDEFARLREQYRVFNQVERPNVINKQGGINIAALNRNLRSSNTGFGRTATAGGSTTNAETQRLIELARAGDKPQFAPFKSSGTAENQALREAVDDVGEAVTGGVPGMVRGIMNQGAPLVQPVLEMGGGLPYDYLFNRAAPSGFQLGGSQAGRSSLDTMFYPFVGAEDERQP